MWESRHQVDILAVRMLIDIVYYTHPVKGNVSRLYSSLSFLLIWPKTRLNARRNLTLSASNKFLFQNIISKSPTTKMNFKHVVRLASFQKLQLQSVFIFFKFVHKCVLFYMLCYLCLLWAVLSVYNSIWWKRSLNFW